MQDNGAGKDVDILRFGAELYETYHNHKEQMSYSIFALQGAFFIGFFMLGNWPPGIEHLSKKTLTMIFIVTWILFHFALRFQLRNRRLAAILVSAFYDAIFKDPEKVKAELVGRGIKELTPPSTLALLLDSFLLPVRKSTWAEPLTAKSFGQVLQDGHVHKQTLRAHDVFLLDHVLNARTTLQGYALPMEWTATLGSIFLLGVAILRVWAS